MEYLTVVIGASTFLAALTLIAVFYYRNDLFHYGGTSISRRSVAAIDWTTRALETVARVVCFNQGAYLQFFFLTGEWHRDLKDKSLEKNPDAGELRQLRAKLLTHINESLLENVAENFGHLHAYFDGRDQTPPRICLKGIRNSDSTPEVVTVFRDHLVDYSFDSSIESNTGFDSIYHNGRYFIDNDLPYSAAINKYYNSRLKLGGREGEKLDVEKVSRKWDSLWDGGEGYRSTLIVPLTLWNNELSPAFRELFKIPEDDRTIFGFLCFDHPLTNYFNEDEDVKVGYVMADLLSFYLFARIVYVEKSKTFSRVEDLIGRSVSSQPELEALVRQLVRRVEETSKADVSFGPPETADNFLFDLDENLIRFIEEAGKVELEA